MRTSPSDTDPHPPAQPRPAGLSPPLARSQLSPGYRRLYAIRYRQLDTRLGTVTDAIRTHAHEHAVRAHSLKDHIRKTSRGLQHLHDALGAVGNHDWSRMIVQSSERMHVSLARYREALEKEMDRFRQRELELRNEWEVLYQQLEDIDAMLWPKARDDVDTEYCSDDDDDDDEDDDDDDDDDDDEEELVEEILQDAEEEVYEKEIRPDAASSDADGRPLEEREAGFADDDDEMEDGVDGRILEEAGEEEKREEEQTREYAYRTTAELAEDVAVSSQSASESIDYWD